MQIRELLDRLDLIESAEILDETAESVLGVIAATLNAKRSLSGTKIAAGIDDPDRQLMKVAGTIAGIQKALASGREDALLSKMEPAAQDEATAGIIDRYAPTGDDTRDRWFKLIQQYEAAIKSKDAAKMPPELTQGVANLMKAARAKTATKPSMMQPKYA